ncbi:hypothetical protein RJZ57_002069 [Blastomyces gilchristii]
MLQNRNIFDRNSFSRRKRQERLPNDMLQNKNSFSEMQKKLQLSKLNKSKFSMKKRKDILLRELNSNRFKRRLRKEQLLSTQLKKCIFNKKQKKELLLQADQEQLVRETVRLVQLQSEKEDRAAVSTAAEKMYTSQPVIQLNFTLFIFSKNEGTHSIIDSVSTE